LSLAQAARCQSLYLPHHPFGTAQIAAMVGVQLRRRISDMLQESCVNNGGKVSREQLHKILSKVASSEIPPGSLDKLLDSIYAGCDGEVHIDDFINSLYGPVPKTKASYQVSVRTPATGFGTVYLAGMKEDHVPVVNRPSDESEPLFNDTIERFREANSGNEELLQTLWNKVKVCSHCKKGCAYTLYTCNSCNASLEDVDITHTENFFAGFIYGVARGKIPYRISVRWQDKDVLCFDDPLAVTPCHLNAIPTSVYVPDLRFLFADPKRGHVLVERLLEVARTTCHDQYWGHAKFRKTYFGDEERPSPEKVGDFALSGMNFPPSMYQLHLQFIHPPLLPFHFNMFMAEGHFSHGRFFPIDYLLKALALGDIVKMKVDDNTDIRAIIDVVNKHGVNYDEHHSALLRKCSSLQQRWSPWKQEMFRYHVINGTTVISTGELGQVVPVHNVDPQGLQKADTKVIQNYGRPYGSDSKPSGTYYKYAKRPGEVKHFCG